jgi:hypothetical protein
MIPAKDVFLPEATDCSLWKLVETCAATFILYFPKLLDDYGDHRHVLVRSFTETMRLNEISIDEIRAWSQNISDHMLSRQLRGSYMETSANERVIKCCEDVQGLLRNVLVSHFNLMKRDGLTLLIGA